MDVVEHGHEAGLAKGIAQYDASELRRIAGRPSAGIAAILGYDGPETVIHRDDLVLL